MHIRVLEGTPESQAALLAGLDLLVAISYVDDTEVGAEGRGGADGGGREGECVLRIRGCSRECMCCGFGFVLC